MRPAIYEKTLTARRTTFTRSRLRLSEGKYPPMYILDVEEGARISTDYVCNYVAKVVAGSLILKILADFYAVS